MSLFGNTPYNHQHIERFVIAFGSLFTGITVVKKDAAGKKLQSYECPIEYAPKHKWLSRVREQNDLTAPQVKMTLPRMAFEMVDIQYAPTRKIGVNGVYALGNINGIRGKIYPPTPYDVVFYLHVVSKQEKNDALQILEQILPYFQPYLTLNYEILPEYKIFKDVPITLQGYQVEDTFEGSPEDQRTITQIFTFSAQMDFFGPMLLNTAIIKDAFVNFGYEFGKPTNATVELKVNPTTASKNDIYTIDTIITERI